MVAYAVLAAQPSAQPIADAAAKHPASSDLFISRDLEYARYGATRLFLDLYRPSRSEHSRLPLIVVIRGGGWRRGDKEGFAFIARYLARSGFATACIEYRTSEKAKFPAAVHDVKASVRWARAHAAQFGFDADRIGLIGCSAGGQLAALVGTSADDPRLEGLGGNSGNSTRVAAVVAMAPVTDFRLTWSKPNGKDGAEFLGAGLHEDDARIALASPVTHVSRQAAPLLLIHSRTDKEVLYEQSTLMKARYAEVGADVQLVTFDEAPHDFWNYSTWFTDSMEYAVRFFRQKFAAR